eukprot:CAMPEP_0194697652 /NCGR_PEP_ID=MMETSP0295-20121207/23560_1 /TAXON_ID=39354 /ORGANISM="Heterosigma akashiwo, Strain CCMP2393" /LENGTH=424 /DNA_ID=CAMNT_0039590377 /DNA_START=445 /DNA_END=1723 /DNA_ORIENTATION=-
MHTQSSLPPIGGNGEGFKKEKNGPDPYCEVCKQGFQTLARLDNHVKYSAVHEINVKKSLESAIQSELQNHPVSARAEEHLLYEGSKLFWRANKNLDLHLYVAKNVVTIVAFDPEAHQEYPRIFLSMSKARAATRAVWAERDAHGRELQRHGSTEPLRRGSHPVNLLGTSKVQPGQAQRRGSFMERLQQEMAGAASHAAAQRRPSYSLATPKSSGGGGGGAERSSGASRASEQAPAPDPTDEDVAALLVSRLEYAAADPAAGRHRDLLLLSGEDDLGLITHAPPDHVPRGQPRPDHARAADHVPRGQPIARRRRASLADYQATASQLTSDIERTRRASTHAQKLRAVVDATMATLESLLSEGRSLRGQQRFRHAAKRVMFNCAYMRTKIFLESKEPYREWIASCRQLRRHTSRAAIPPVGSRSVL